MYTIVKTYLFKLFTSKNVAYRFRKLPIYCLGLNSTGKYFFTAKLI